MLLVSVLASLVRPSDMTEQIFIFQPVMYSRYPCYNAAVGGDSGLLIPRLHVHPYIYRTSAAVSI